MNPSRSRDAINSAEQPIGTETAREEMAVVGSSPLCSLNFRLASLARECAARADQNRELVSRCR
jgi:hypothetical protein